MLILQYRKILTSNYFFMKTFGLSLLLFPIYLFAQTEQNNLVLNPSFEEKLNFKNNITLHNFFTESDTFSQNDTFYLSGNFKRNLSNIIAKNWNYAIEISNAFFSDVNYANTGSCFGLIKVIDTFYSKQEYLLQNMAATLCKPLVKGHQYRVSFFIKPFSGNHYTKSIGAVFLENPYPVEVAIKKTTQKPVEALPKNYNWCLPEILNNTFEYTKYEFIYTATGNEKYLYIGNILFETPEYFSKKELKKYYQHTKQYGYYKNHDKAFQSIYALDDVSVEPLNNSEICNDSSLPTLVSQEKINVDTILLATCFFDYNKAELNNTIDSVINLLYYSNQFSKIVIIGHTDKEGSEQYNQSLSIKRAAFVYENIKYFTQSPIEIFGMGSKLLISGTNNSLNRRVEILGIQVSP